MSGGQGVPSSRVPFAAPCVARLQVLAYAGVPEALQGKLKANDWVAAVLGVVGGKGGGKAGLAQGQGTNVERLAEAVAVADSTAAKAL